MLRHLSLLPLHTNKPQPANNEFYSSFKHSYCSEKQLVDTNLHPRENYQCKIFGEYDFFVVQLDDLKGKLTLTDATGLVHRATEVCTMSHGAGLPWLCMWAWVSLRPWIFSQLFFSTSVFFFSIDWQTGRGGQWKACTPEEASVCVSAWYMPLFHVDHCQIGVQSKVQEAEPWLTHLYVFNLSAFKVSSGRKRDAWKRQMKLKNSSWCENIKKKKKGLGHIL